MILNLLTFVSLQLWLALASLCVLDQEHVERLSSGQWVGGAGGDGQQSQPRVRVYRAINGL